MGLDCCMRIIAEWTFRVWGAGINGGSSGGPVRDRRIGPCSSRDCLIGFSPAIKQRVPGESHRRGGRDRQRSYDPPRHSFATVRATR